MIHDRARAFHTAYPTPSSHSINQTLHPITIDYPSKSIASAAKRTKVHRFRKSSHAHSIEPELHNGERTKALRAEPRSITKIQFIKRSRCRYTHERVNRAGMLLGALHAGDQLSQCTLEPRRCSSFSLGRVHPRVFACQGCVRVPPGPLCRARCARGCICIYGVGTQPADVNLISTRRWGALSTFTCSCSARSVRDARG